MTLDEEIIRAKVFVEQYSEPRQGRVFAEHLDMPIFIISIFFAISTGAYAQSNPTAPTETPATSDEIPLHHWNVDPLAMDRGYKIGFLNNVRAEGVVIKTLEGRLYLGYRSTGLRALDQDCMMSHEKILRDIPNQEDQDEAQRKAAVECEITQNPWEFSSLNTDYVDTMTKMGDPLLIYFIRYRVYPFTETNNIVQQFWPVKTSKKLPATSIDRLDEIPLAGLLHYQNGVIEGRIVSATIEGNVRENYEVIIQVGTTGNNFVKMNISHSDIFDYAVQVMSTGHYLRIHYLKLFGIEAWPLDLIKGYRTHYRIYRIEVIPEPNVDVP